MSRIELREVSEDQCECEHMLGEHAQVEDSYACMLTSFCGCKGFRGMSLRTVLANAGELTKELELAGDALSSAADALFSSGMTPPPYSQQAVSVDFANPQVERALGFAERFGGIDGAHHKAWVIDQMVRALTGCPMVGDLQGESEAYRTWVDTVKDGEDGPETYSWDEGIPP